MRVFVTGASGFIGSATVRELIGADHEVLGLARSDPSAEALSAAGAKVHRGSLEDLDSLKSGAAASDAVIHLAFIHDFSKFEENGQIDWHAIEALGSVLAGSDRPLIVTSGTALLQRHGPFATEENSPIANSPRKSEEVAESVAAQGVRVSVVRLTPTVHGEGDHGFVSMLINLAREKGRSVYVGEGANRWSAVHRLDAAHLYRLAVEKGSAGAKYHGVAEEGVPFREIAGVIGKHLDIPVVSISPDEAAEHFGWMALFAGIDNPSSSAQTQAELGWHPTQPGLIADLDQGHYFAS